MEQFGAVSTRFAAQEEPKGSWKRTGKGLFLIQFPKGKSEAGEFCSRPLDKHWPRASKQKTVCGRLAGLAALVLAQTRRNAHLWGRNCFCLFDSGRNAINNHPALALRSGGRKTKVNRKTAQNHTKPHCTHLGPFGPFPFSSLAWPAELLRG